ncbi:hypothetical protein EF128_23220 [Escherichia coli]|nr:hypothetical protein [Escherichia coli]EEW0419831.1 hypothetical protein [Escherichia coli]EEW4305482.1 hypothetical protein [Escherichia coli]EEW4350720.1 hypothetical protein [Escherichia coli]EEX9685343.1 hypothetical protein [Escherichia coli]
MFSQTPDENDLVNATNCHDVSPSVDVFSPHHLLSFGSRGFDVLRDVHFTPGLAETVVAVSAPGDRGLNR